MVGEVALEIKKILAKAITFCVLPWVKNWLLGRLWRARTRRVVFTARRLGM